MSPEALLVACSAITALSAIALPLLLNPDSFLSRLVDGPDETNREVTPS